MKEGFEKVLRIYWVNWSTSKQNCLRNSLVIRQTR